METNYSKAIKDKINRIKPGSTFQYDDFNLNQDAFHILATILSSMVRKGQLIRISRGNFLKPDHQQSTPEPEKLIEDLLKEGRRQTCYLTGQRIFHSLGLTPLSSEELVLGTNQWRPPVTRMGVSIKFVPQPNRISRYKIPYLQILDAIKEVKNMRGSTPEEVSRGVLIHLQSYSSKEMDKLIELALHYNPSTRALTGAMAESLGYRSRASALKSSLNPFSIYTLHIPVSVLPNKQTWRIQ